MRYETTVVRESDEGMPSLRAIGIVAHGMGLGHVQFVTEDKSQYAMRLPHPPSVVRVLLDFALAWQEAEKLIKDTVAIGPVEGDIGPVVAADLMDQRVEAGDVAYDVHASGEDVHISFDDGGDDCLFLSLPGEEAMKFAEHCRTAAAQAIATAEGDTSGSSSSGTAEA